MKILQLIQKPQLRGAEMFASQLSNHLQVQGHEVVLVSLFKEGGELSFRGKQIHLDLAGKVRWLDYGGFKALAKVIKGENPDLIQANAGDTLKYAVLSRLLFGWKQAIVFRNASMVSLYIKNPLVKKLNGFLYSKVDAIASVSQQSKIDLNTLFPITKDKSKVIPIGIEVGEQRIENGKWGIEKGVEAKRRSREERIGKQGLESERSGDPERNESGKGNGELCIAHVGGFSFEKNHKGLLSIFKKLLNIYPNAKLNLIGDGILRNETEILAQEMGIGKSVEFLGFQTNPMRFVKQADVFVLPSIIEGLPGVILEAFDCQTPVVAYNVGGVGEVVRNEQTGLLITKNDEEGFVQAMIETIEDQEKTKEIVNRAYQLVQKDFRNEVIAGKFASYYKEVLDSQPVPYSSGRL